MPLKILMQENSYANYRDATVNENIMKSNVLRCQTNEQSLSGCSTTPSVISVSNSSLVLNVYAATVTTFISLVVWVDKVIKFSYIN